MGKKKTISGFVIYTNEQRPKLKAEEPGLSFGEIATRLGQNWKALSADERASYELKAKAKRQVGRKAA
jgi:hypothetical protein